VLVVFSLAATAHVVPPESAPTERAERVFRLGRYGRFGLLLVAGAGVTVVGVPLANLVYKAGLVVEQVGDQWLRHWSGWKLLCLVGGTPARYGEEFVWSLIIGAASATAAIGLGAPLAWSARKGRVGALPALAIIALGLAIPGPIIGLRLIWLLNRETSDLLVWLYDRTILAPVLAQVVRSLPIATLVCWYAMRSVADDLLDAAAVDGAGAFARFWWVVVPQRAPSLAAAWLAALAVSVGDLSASILVVPPGVTTITVRVFGLLHSGVDDQVAGISLNVAIGFALVASLAIWMWRRGDRVVRQTGSERV
jgi:iron(III) transport system permease protein